MSDHPPFDPARAGRKLLREARSGALATLAKADGSPYCSLVNVATLADGTPLLLVSRLALHTQNLLSDPRVSLMLDERRDGDPLQGTRIMLSGRAEREESLAARRRYLAFHPDAAVFVDFPDFVFYRVGLAGGHLVAGFGRIVDLSAAELLTNLAGAETLVGAEAEVCDHLNADHTDALRLYATQLLRAPEGEWRCVGCDPDGLDLQMGRNALRLPFGEPVRSPGVLRQVLKRLAEEARAARTDGP